MITIHIGNDSRSLEDADEAWIAQQITNRRQEGLSVCVRVTIHTATLQISLTTPDCGPGVGGRAPRPDEAAVIDLWEKHKLTSTDFAGGHVIAFLKQLQRHL